MFPTVETGYKPEFALGALYAGENAAAQQAMQDEELIKSFLANQRERQMQPLDVDIKGYEAAKARSQNTPELLQKFTQNQEAVWDKGIRENEIGSILHPFMKEAAPLQGAEQVNKAKLTGELSRLDNILRTGISDNGLPLSPELRADLEITREQLIANMGRTPELFGKLAVEDRKGEWDLEKARIMAAAQAANRGAVGEKPPKTAEEALTRQLVAEYSAGRITLEQLNAELANIFNVKNTARVPQGGTQLDPSKLGNSPLVPKPPAPQYKPGTGQTNQQSIEDKVKATGIKYEPDKYEYRVTEDGKVQRKSKGN